MKSEFSQFQSSYWTVDYPINWIVERHSECASFYAQDGVGSLQINAYSKDEEITQKDLTEFICEEVPEGEELRQAAVGEYIGLETDYKYIDHYWRMWLLKKNNIMLYVTYNCEFEDKNIETSIVNQIINSLK